MARTVLLATVAFVACGETATVPPDASTDSAPEDHIDTDDDVADVVPLGDGGVVDPTFANGLRDWSFIANTLAIGPKASIYVGGTATNCVTPASGRDFVVAKLTAGGQLDTTFANGGVSCFRTGTFATDSDEAITSIHQRPNGTLGFAGTAYSPVYNEHAAIIGLLDANGAPVTSFGAGGTQSALTPDIATDALSVEDGGIQATTTNLAGTQGGLCASSQVGNNLWCWDTNTPSYALAHTGFFDTYLVGSRSDQLAVWTYKFYQTADLAVLDLGWGPETATAVDMTSPSFVVGGVEHVSLGVGSAVALRMSRTTGALDTAFGSGGVAHVPALSSRPALQSRLLVVDSAQRILIGGSLSVGAQRDGALARLTMAGVLDETFAQHGIQSTLVPGDDDMIAMVRHGDKTLTLSRTADQRAVLIQFSD